ncbi:SCO family protein [Herminiimonas contaminans]|nr:SCO family protein [Herminiimonas contaminans]
MSPTAIDITGLEYGKDFKLSDPGGKERTLKEFRGKVVMVFFGFTQCPDVCPTALYRAAEVKKKLGEEGSKFQTIFVTVDPERDTPTLLKDYTHAFDDSFLGLYTDLENTRKTADDFRIYYAKVSTGSTYTMDHTAISYLYDTKGNIRIGIKPNASIDDVTQDVRFLLQN